MNILTFDTEEWYFEKNIHGGRDWKYKQLDELLDRLLDGDRLSTCSEENTHCWT